MPDIAHLIKQLSVAFEHESKQWKSLERELKNVQRQMDTAKQQLRNREYQANESSRQEGETSGTNSPAEDDAWNNNNGDFQMESASANAELIGVALQKDREPEAPPRGRRHSRVSVGSSDWHESDVREFAMMKGWRLIERRGSGRSGSSFDMVASMISGSYSNRQKSKFQLQCKWIVETHTFDILSAVAILVNSFLIGLIGNYAAQHGLLASEIPSSFLIAERIFTGVFFVELAMRMIAYRCEFFCGVHRSWHLFDLLVVSADILQTILETIFTDTSVDLSILRVVRLVRVTRAVRVIKVIRFFKELRMMIYSILRCGTSLLWSLILFLTITYIFGMFLMSQVTDFLATEGKNHPRRLKMKEYFGSVAETVYTLYCCMSGGISWKEISDDLNDIGWANGFALCFCVFFTLFVVSNILTGIFVDTAIQSAASDRDEVIQEQIANQESELMTLKSIFEEADTDESGTISVEEFKQHLESNTVRAHFAHIGIQVNQAMGLFKLLDQDHSGQIGIEEFVMGCMRMKGGAKGIDLATLMYENKRLVEKMKDLEFFCVDQFAIVLKNQGAMLHEIRLPPSSDALPIREGAQVGVVPHSAASHVHEESFRRSAKLGSTLV